ETMTQRRSPRGRAVRATGAVAFPITTRLPFRTNPSLAFFFLAASFLWADVAGNLSARYQGMSRLPAGEIPLPFRMDSATVREKVASFYLDKRAVTLAEFKAFLRERAEFRRSKG